jgi:hypothetical protein
MSATVIPLRVDGRIVYGANCSWWDSIDKIGRRPFRDGSGSMPCCPGCGGMLLEMPNQKVWWDAVARYERANRPGYRDLVEWVRGKCFAGGYPEAAVAYAAELNSTHRPERS